MWSQVKCYYCKKEFEILTTWNVLSINKIEIPKKKNIPICDNYIKKNDIWN
jgi:hypothetical protein